MKDLDKMLSDIEKTPAKQYSFTPPEKEKKPKRALKLTAATAAVLAAAILTGFAIAPLFKAHPVETTTGDGSREPGESTYDEPEKMPWDDGGMILTSVTYKSEYAYERLSSSVAENIELSLLADAKISGCINCELLKITSAPGHEGCADVYYNVKTDETLCLTCLLTSAVKATAYYADACVRSLIEDCFITKTVWWAGDVDGEYARYYNDFYSADKLALILSGAELTEENLGLRLYEDDAAQVRENLAKHKNPTVKVWEYGENENFCLFSIISPATGVCYSTFIYNLSDNTAEKLDGDSVGISHSLSGYATANTDYVPLINFSEALGIEVNSDYTKIAVTVPYFCKEIILDGDFTVHPIYSGYNVFILTAGGAAASIGETYQPTRTAKLYGTHTVYDTFSGFCVDGTVEFSGEFYKILSTSEGDCAVLRSDGEFHIRRISDGAELTEAVKDGTTTADCAFVLDGMTRVSLDGGKNLTVSEKTAAASVTTRDGRYLYVYFAGDAFVTCVDLYGDMQIGTLPISEKFLLQSAAADAEYLLFMNYAENRLLLAYYKEGELYFDFEAFAAEVDTRYLTAENFSGDFSDGVSAMLPYFMLGETSGEFSYSSGKNAHTIAQYAASQTIYSALEAAYLTGLFPDGSVELTEEIYSAAAAAIIKAANYKDGKIIISSDALAEAVGGMSAESIAQAFENLKKPFVPFKVEVDYPGGTLIDELSESVADSLLLFVHGYTTHDEPYDDVWAEYYAILNEGFDDTELLALRESYARQAREMLEGYELKSEYTCGYALTNAYLEVFYALTEKTAGQKIDTIVSSGGYLNVKYGSFLLGKTGGTALGIGMNIDKTRLDAFTSALTFTKGEINGMPRFGVYLKMCRLNVADVLEPEIPLIYCCENGGERYAVINGYYAALTDEQYREFQSICAGTSLYGETDSASELLDSLLSGNCD